ncbi:MAG: hypothetical protein AAGK17_08675, partial [Pseudomonadota bacterium]
MANILLVEDDQAIATVIIAALEDEGFDIHHCTQIAQRDVDRTSVVEGQSVVCGGGGGGGGGGG